MSKPTSAYDQVIAAAAQDCMGFTVEQKPAAYVGALSGSMAALLIAAKDSNATGEQLREMILRINTVKP